MDEDPIVSQCRARVGQQISGKWRLDALIGVGGMAAVYMATHRNGSIGAIKLLHDEVARNDEVRERFLREAYIANKVGHPGTVKVLDDDKDERGTPYLVMELLQGESVEAKAEKAGGRLPIDETLDIVDQTLAVLEAAHKHTIIHRDLKPENLFFTRDNQLKVLDFGIARLREENSRKTQTGMVMGTPSFMAPEQAMGRWNDVDQRTDLYAVGATAFTLLSGRPVHEAETAGEMLVAAATRPARSLARVLNNAPFNLVALIDRALAYERDHRFPNATAFREELAKVRGGLTAESVSKAEVIPQAQVVPATIQGEVAPDGYDKVDRGERLQTFDPSTNSAAEVERMQKVFTLLERALVARKQYSPDHPEPKRRLEESFKELASALMTCDICLAWNFTPYAFTAGDNVVWEPEPPWNRIPYQLFSDGVRTMGFVPGLDEQEFQEWVDLVTLDPTMDLAPEDDLVTSLWDAGFQHVFHQAIDSFSEGNQEQRARYEAERNAVINGAHADYLRDAADSYRKDQAAGGARSHESAGSKTKQVIDFVNKSSPLDAEAAARVANMNLQDQSPDEMRAAQSVMVDDATRALLSARLDTDVGATSERFVVAAAEAFVASAKMGRSAAVTAPLRRAVDGLSAGEPEKAMDMIVQLRETVQIEGKAQETESLRDTITAEVLSPKTLLDILKNSNKLSEDRRQVYLKGLSKVLECIQSQHFDSAIAFLPESPPGKIRELLLDFMRRGGRGYEPKIGALFETADVELGLDLVRLLVGMETDTAKEAVAMASRSPHPLVRIEALGHLEGVSGTRVRAEMRKLLDDDQLDVRLAALQAMHKYSIAAAGPFLVLRMQDKAFLKLPFDEREQSMKTLSALRPKRCEEVCVALLSESKLLRSSALETTRALAARYLAEVASTDEAYRLLERVANSKPWHSSKEVREAATAALARLTERAQQAIEARKSAHEAKRQVDGASGRTTAGTKRKRKTQAPGQKPAEGKPAAEATAATASEPGAEKSATRAKSPTSPSGTQPTRPGGARGRASTAGGS
jgi:serine/threonine protein kinase